ncbi:uridine kinase [Catenuloplanes nepalensis]|uniref:Uridine kinase n=1 Tax=Catenuloplanes nepalensis TaxID=587533 RepID=A0ABT9MRA9_9ACTN|nr:dephospho-CoA kinase [Catenuloplanes nepalensis]MDP9793970.1 uridine kinase [Catenuloplanes nepalensis]
MSGTERVLAWVRTLPAAAGRTRVVAVEGRSGAGKTGLAGALADALHAPLVRMDDLYPGWDGLRGGVEALHDWILAPLAAGHPIRRRSWDWAADAYRDWEPLTVGTDLVVEGVGCGARALAPYRSGLIWIDAPDDVRRRRALERDGEAYAPHWERWARQEDTFYAANRVRANADLIIDNSGGTASGPPLP